MAKEMPTSVLRTAREAGKIEGHACGLPRGCIIVTRIIQSIAKFFVHSMETLIFRFFFLLFFLIFCTFFGNINFSFLFSSFPLNFSYIPWKH